MILGISVEHLSILPVSKSVVNKSCQHNIIVEVGSLWVLIKVGWVKEDTEPVSRETGDGVGEGDTVALGARGPKDRRLHEG